VRRRSGGERGETEKTLSVLLSFEVESLLGSVSYPLRTFVVNLLLCFRTQVAAVCRRKILKCEKCAGGHETKESVVSVEKVVLDVGVPIGVGVQRCLV
jgi:hypothetical protein